MPLIIFCGAIFLRALPLRGICICRETSWCDLTFDVLWLSISHNSWFRDGGLFETIFPGTQWTSLREKRTITMASFLITFLVLSWFSHILLSKAGSAVRCLLLPLCSKSICLLLPSVPLTTWVWMCKRLVHTPRERIFHQISLLFYLWLWFYYISTFLFNYTLLITN